MAVISAVLIFALIGLPWLLAEHQPRWEREARTRLREAEDRLIAGAPDPRMRRRQ
jgi:hypothetical protein